MKSQVGDAIERAIASGVCISVYLDDFVGSHNDPIVLAAAYEDIRSACVDAGFIPNPAKLVPPSDAITVFNCDLTRGSATVTPARAASYWASRDRTPMSDAGFVHYEALVSAQNTP
jgi:hypothetical protein